MSEIPIDEQYENLIVRTLESTGFTSEQAEALSAELQLLRGDMESIVDQFHQEQDNHVTREEFEGHSELSIQAASNITELSEMVSGLSRNGTEMMQIVNDHAASLNGYINEAVANSEKVAGILTDLMERMSDLEKRS